MKAILFQLATALSLVLLLATIIAWIFGPNFGMAYGFSRRTDHVYGSTLIDWRVIQAGSMRNGLVIERVIWTYSGGQLPTGFFRFSNEGYLMRPSYYIGQDNQVLWATAGIVWHDSILVLAYRTLAIMASVLPIIYVIRRRHISHK
jgi:hypothetical protein